MEVGRKMAQYQVLFKLVSSFVFLYEIGSHSETKDSARSASLSKF
jgi:hypothetical protein